MDLVSIIMPYYKKREYIKSAVLSVLNQTYQNFEVYIIFDDKNVDDLEFINEIVALDNDDKLENVTAVALIVAIVAVPSTVSDCVSIALPYIFSTFCASVPSVCVLTPLSVNVPLIVVSPPSIEPAVTTMFANVPVLVEPVISPVTPRLPPTVKSPVTLAAPGIFNWVLTVSVSTNPVETGLDASPTAVAYSVAKFDVCDASYSARWLEPGNIIPAVLPVLAEAIPQTL